MFARHRVKVPNDEGPAGQYGKGRAPCGAEPIFRGGAKGGGFSWPEMLENLRGPGVQYYRR